MSQTKIKNKTNNKHLPVMLNEVIASLAPKNGESYLDLTAGYGGHAKSVLEVTKSRAILVDRDINAINELNNLFSGERNIEIRHQDFLQACRDIAEEQVKFDLILADLGVSSPHLDNANRGFSINQDGPLDMRMDESIDLTAEKVVNTYSVTDLERILKEYGEEPKAKQMAKLIIDSRPLRTTHELAEVAKKVWRGFSKTHPATRLFQAIRIEVNDELGQLKEALPIMVKLLKPGGRIAIITFHSLEDRIVKQYLQDKSGDRYDADLSLLNKRPILASDSELAFNPRSRSAKLRVAQAKIKTKEGQG